MEAYNYMPGCAGLTVAAGCHSYKAPAAFLESLHRVTADGVGASTEGCDQRSDFIRC